MERQQILSEFDVETCETKRWTEEAGAYKIRMVDNTSMEG